MPFDFSRLDVLADNPGLTLLNFAAGAAETGGWVDPETLVVMQGQVEAGAVSALPAAAVWPLLARGLMGEQPSRMLLALRECRALAVLLPELDALFGCVQSASETELVDIGLHQCRVVDAAARHGAPLAVRFAALLFNLGKADSPPQHLPTHYKHVERCLPRIEAICARFPAGPALLDLALLTALELERVHRAVPMRAASIAALLERVDAFGRPQRFADLMAVCACDYEAYPSNGARAYPKATLMDVALDACLKVGAGGTASEDVEDVHEARALAVARALGSVRWGETA